MKALGIPALFPFVALAQFSNDIPPLRPPRPEIPATFWEQNTVSVGLLCFALMAFAGVALWFVIRPRPPVVLPPEVLAGNELGSLRGLPESGAVLSRVSQIVRRYFGAVFALPPGELTTSEFSAAIAANDRIGLELATATVEFLRRCDELKFAPDAQSQESGAVERALNLVERAEARRAQWRRIAGNRAVAEGNFRTEVGIPLTGPPVSLSPSDGERDGVRGLSENDSAKKSGPDSIEKP